MGVSGGTLGLWVGPQGGIIFCDPTMHVTPRLSQTNTGVQSVCSS